MYPRPIEARYLGEHRLMVAFEDGVRAELDFSPMVSRGGMYEGLKEPAAFARVVIDTEGETLSWPGGVDVCPDVLYHLATGSPLMGDLPRPPARLVHMERSVARAG